ncbi:hypothetical protein JKF63_07383 [Porcisia hertigi]|uniref:MSP domain-containing protein n=1 Tax=Porcisia hertigi TaxID=2761500 RepID=A0A836LKT5_9TRYP|nr:hypothetical protein JKF63_07383 [Porcisia hertigi]
MTLTASCDALYFPVEPRDNIVTVQWSAVDASLAPNTSVIFKVKCTTPQLFRALPRYGALLLTDAIGAAMPTLNQRTAIRFTLRPNHSGGGDDDGGSHRNSILSQQAASRVSRPTPSGKAYQERFAIDYVVIKSEPLAFQRILNNFTDAAQLTGVVKGIWSLTDSGAIPRAHLGSQGAISLKVYMENVVLRLSDPAPAGCNEATKIVVPPEACLVMPSSSEPHVPNSHYVTKAGHRQPASSASEQPPSSESKAGHKNGTLAAARRKSTDELRALQEEINTMRSESLTPRSTAMASVRNSYSPCANTPNNPLCTRDGIDAMGTPAASFAPATATSSNYLDDLIMKIDLGAAPVVKTQRGLKVYVVLLLMFVLYVFLLLLRRIGGRGGRHDRQSRVVGATDKAHALKTSS